MRIALMRSGTVLYADNHAASPVAGNQDALGVLRYLKQSGHDVALFGAAPYDENGNNLFGYDKFLGVDSFGINFSGTPYETTKPEEYNFRLEFGLSLLRQWEPEICINVAGQQPSHSNPMNPWGTSPLRTAITTNFPVLAACEALKLPRIVIINDPRNLPREHENQYMPYTLPVAVLSQRSKLMPWTLKERPGWPSRTMRREEVYSACENWWTFGMPLATLDNERAGTIVMAHSHSHDLRVYGPERTKTWETVLKNGPTTAEIYGHGWAYCEECNITKNFSSLEEVEEHKAETQHNPHVHPQWRGCVKHDLVQGILSRSAGGPMICLERGFATGKLREYVVAGALPRPVSFGKFHYDYDNRYFPADHPARIKMNQPWAEIPRSEAIGYIEELRLKSTPDFTPLEAALEATKNGTNTGQFGGYRWQ